ncbi:hypothetical protein LV779_26180 [Streptomyces thinghirensis]|nr:hypothetical protein [Streptomyces thinghirensis]
MLLAVVGFEGTPRRTPPTAATAPPPYCARAAALLRRRGTGERWAHGRYSAPYLRDSLLDAGALAETLETATYWSRLPALYAAVRDALHRHPHRSRHPAAGHVPHLARLRERCSPCTSPSSPPRATTPWRTGTGPSTPPTRRSSPRAAPSPTTTASAPTTATGTSGRAGSLGVEALRAVKRSLDPAGLLSPGVLLPED